MSDPKSENAENLTTTIADTAQQAVDLPAELLRTEIQQASEIYQVIIDFFTNYSFQLVGALLIFLLGYSVAGKVAKAVLRLCEKQKLDVTLSRFLASTTKMAVMVMITIMALSKLGISVTPFIAAIGAISLGAGLALQGLLANYAAGFNIIIIRPFVVGDTIEVQGVTGIVKEVQLAYTIIKNEDSAEITIPNKHIVGEVVLNSRKDSLLKLSVGISYKDNPIDVVKLVERTLSDLDIYTDEVRMQVGIDEFADSAITIGIRLWIPTTNLYAAKYSAYEAIYLAFEQENVTIPFPQQDIHLIEPKQVPEPTSL
ncbi:mechanosensitive ion channel family protein [Colwellia psychrerythraea]|uniref:Small-conductance mechanosensitive channel n=1 Tax=Colwellia psychrerythraea TaxID=28229 RepID=A0A099L702_COLPS|nr:mechanosensitive ion channel family protein [Colwellia psychrerythraea]KGJ97648.1 MscS Mechanosensitive ion channel [Colwellia psychrerythraea]